MLLQPGRGYRLANPLLCERQLRAQLYSLSFAPEPLDQCVEWHGPADQIPLHLVAAAGREPLQFAQIFHAFGDDL